VADTSLQQDQQIKRPRFANGGVPEYWIVDLVGNVVLVYRDPDGGDYRSVERKAGDDTLSIQAFHDAALRAGEVLGR
jgi:Uma2 family endonuclease